MEDPDESSNIELEPVVEQPVLSKMTNGDLNKDVVFTGKVVQVTNVSPGATLQQLATLFGFVGTVTDIRLYPSDELMQVAVKVCYIKYENADQCGVAQHLTNTVFIDKALIVLPLNREEIPEETECSHLIKTVNAYASMATTGFLPQIFPMEESTSSIPGLPPPPVITCSTDPVEIEEIRRTIYVDNINDTVKSEQLLAFFSGVGEIKYLRLCKAEVGKYAFIEFSTVESVPTALQYNGVLFGSRLLRVVHAKSAIFKPESEKIATGRTPVRKYREAVQRPSIDRHISRSRSPPRRRSRTKSPIRKRRSRSRSNSRSRRRRSRTRSPRRRSRSPRRRRSRSRSSKAQRSKKDDEKKTSPPPRRRSRSRSRSRSPRRRRSRSRSSNVQNKRNAREDDKKTDRRRRRRSASRSLSRSPRRRSRRKSRSRSPARRKSRRSPSKSPDRSSSKKKRREKERDRSKEREKSKDMDKDDTDKQLDSLLNKIHALEEEQKKSQDSSDESSKKKRSKNKDSS